MAIQESENGHNSTVSLLSNEETVMETDLQEKSNMDVRKEEEDILAVTQELSQDLSAIASNKTEESEEGKKEEEPVVAEGDDEEGQEPAADEDAGEEKSEEDAEKSEEQAKDAVDSDDSVTSEESAEEEKAEENQESEGSAEDLSDKAEQPAEQENDDLKRIKALEEENAKLKAALHRILVERVVDAKISAGVEEADSRDELIESHLTRTAASLADSLRDLAKMPVRKVRSSEMPEFNNESAFASDEDKVTTIDDEGNSVSSKEEVSVEQVFVDALMGRRKL